MMHLVTAWKTEAREGEPKVLYCGFDAKKATHVANTAPSKFLRVEKAFVTESYKQRRPQRPTASPASDPAVAKSEPEQKPAAAAPVKSDDALGAAPKESVETEK